MSKARGRIKQLLMLVVVVAVFAGIARPLQAQAAVQIGSFQDLDGDGQVLSWSYDDETKTLTISGTGEIRNWSYNFSSYWIEKIEKITFSECTVIGSMILAFDDMKNLKEIDFSGLDTSNVTDMAYMFSRCSGLSFLDLSNFDTSNVTDMACMFYGCSSLSSLNVSNFDTSNVTDMACMFYDCSKLRNLDLNNFDMSNVTSTGKMFSGCSVFTEFCTPCTIGATPIDLPALFVDSAGNVTRVLTAGFENMLLVRVGAEERILFEYSLNDRNEATITKYNGNEAELDIPEVIDGYTVVEIGERAFIENCELTEVSLPDTIENIGSYAFSSCKNLKTVVLSKNLERMGEGAFCNCDFLTSIEIPKSLTYAYRAFAYCDNLKEIKFEQGTTMVAGGVFTLCSGLEEIVIPDTVTVIGGGAFNGCENLKRVVFPSNLEKIECNAFIGCHSLTNIEIPQTLTTIEFQEYQDDSVYYIFGAFTWCDNLKNIIFEQGTITVAGGLFPHCSGLEEIILPNTVTSIQDYAFFDCENLTKITMGREVTSISETAFSYPEKMTVYGYSGTYVEEWANIAGAKFIDLSTYGPADILEEQLDEAVTSALKAATELDAVKMNATAEEKRQAVDSVLEQMQTACQKQNLEELGVLSADTAISYVTQLGAVEERIGELLGTTVSVVHKDDTQTFALPTVANALLNVPAGESAVIKVAEVKSPVFDEVEDQTVMALTFELFNSAGQKLSLSVPVLVVMPIPSTVDVQKEIVIYHFREDGTSYTEKIPVVLDEKAGTISFVVGSFSTFVIANAPDGIAVSGTVTSFGDETAQTTVRILDGNESEVARTTVAGKSVTYALEGILPGTYTLEVSKASHVTRRYSITVESEAVVQDAGIWLIGDVNGDGNINSKDKKVLFNHIAGNSVLTDYAFLVGDITGDGNINSKDKKAMFNHIAGTSRLW